MSLEGTERFSIGEVARMFRVSVSTLRHYEKIGLLAPGMWTRHRLPVLQHPAV